MITVDKLLVTVDNLYNIVDVTVDNLGEFNND